MEMDPQSAKLSSSFKVSETPVDFIDIADDNTHQAAVLAQGNRQVKLIDLRSTTSQCIQATLEDILHSSGLKGSKTGPFESGVFSQAKWLPDGHTIATSSASTV